MEGPPAVKLKSAGLKRPEGGGAGCRSVLKRDADEIALPPDDAALANGVKFVETQFEIRRQDIEGAKFDSGAHVRDVLNAAGEYAALFVKEQQSIL